MGVKSVVRKIGGKAGDKVAKLATLSPSQVLEVKDYNGKSSKADTDYVR